jgi:catechol 2,3-dioxygenase-like lactoylglutathione lyase family enzyme
MITGIAQIALLVHEYEEAKKFYCDKLGFILIEDTPLLDKRWVRLKAPGNLGSEILLSKATDEKQKSTVGNQAGGRVLFFFQSDDFDHDYQRLKSQGIAFTEAPRLEPYGKVAVFTDLYGNRIDLIEAK